jgi:hypothetical protein
MTVRYSAKWLTWEYLKTAEHVVQKVLGAEFPGRLSAAELGTLQRASDTLRPSMQKLEKNFAKGGKNAAYENLLSLLRAFEAIGALAIMTESQKSFFGPIVIKEKYASAGLRSGKARNKKADTEWRAHAIELARQLREQAPSISQETLASYIQDKWKLPRKDLPAYETIRKFIASEEKAGRLPPKTKKAQKNW